MEDHELGLRHVIDRVECEPTHNRQKFIATIALIDKLLHGDCSTRQGKLPGSTIIVDLRDWTFRCTDCEVTGELLPVFQSQTRVVRWGWTSEQIKFWLSDIAIWLKPHLLLLRYPHLKARCTAQELLEQTRWVDAQREKI